MAVLQPRQWLLHSLAIFVFFLGSTSAQLVQDNNNNLFDLPYNKNTLNSLALRAAAAASSSSLICSPKDIHFELITGKKERH